MDGTLGDTLPICFTAYQSAFNRFLGRHYSEHEISSFFGPNEEGIIRRLVPGQWQGCLQSYLDAYEKAYMICDKPFAGIEEALHFLKQRQVALAVITGKGERSTDISLRYLGIAHYFDVVETGSTDGDIKPLKIQKVLARWNMLAHRVAYVGDSPSDVEAAKQSGLVPVGAAWPQQ